MNYWDSIEDLIKRNGITIDRKKGTRHPKYNDLIYVVDYGYINNSSAMDNNEIDIFVGTNAHPKVIGIFCTIDILKNDSEIKVVFGCSLLEINQINDFLNNSKYMKAIYVGRP